MNSKPSSELEWLLYHLWLKTGPAAPQFIFTLADTIFYRQPTSSSMPTDLNIPECWYFTSKDGYILKKNRFNVSPKEIHKAFTKKLEVHDQVAAIAYYSESDHLQCTNEMFIQHLTPIELKAHLFYSNQYTEAQLQQILAIQKYVPSKQIKNTVFRCTLSSKTSEPLVEKLQNINSFFDSKVPLEERVATFETSTPADMLSLQESTNIPQQVYDNLLRCLKQIQNHLFATSRVELIGGRFYFKIDRRTDNLILFFAHNIAIKCESRANHLACLGETFNVQINQWRKKSKPVFLSSVSTESVEKQQPHKLRKQQSSGEMRIIEKQYTRPQSNYSSSQRGIQKSDRQKMNSGQCPFCDNELVESSYEVTINQIFKLQSNIKACKSMEEVNLACDFVQSITQFDNGAVPKFLLRVLPNLTNDILQKKKQDPAFLYDSLQICDACYSQFKELMNTIKLTEKTKQTNQEVDGPSKPPMNKLPKLPERYLLSFPQPSNAHDSQIIKEESEAEVTIANVKNQLSSLQKQEANPYTSLDKSLSDKKVRTSFNSVSPQVYKKITGIESARESLAEESQEEKPMMMMFSKVEAGKQVSEQLVKLKVDEEDKGKVQVIEKIEKQQTEEQPNSRKTQQVKQQRYQPKEEEQKSVRSNQRDVVVLSQQKNLIGQKKQNKLPSIPSKAEWEKSYTKQMKSKTRQVTNEILDTCDKIEKGEVMPPLSLKNLQSESELMKQRFYQAPQVLGSLNIDLSEGSLVPNLVQESRMFDNFTPVVEQDVSQVNDQVQIPNLKKRRGQPNNVRQPLYSQQQNYQMNNKKVSTDQLSKSPTQERLDSKKRLLTAYGISGFSKMALIPASQFKARQRPQSSKPPIHMNYGSSGSSVPLSVNTTSAQDTESRIVNRSKKNCGTKKNTSNNNGGALNILDFKNMNEEHIKQIAEKADQLIEIIQNIKDKVGGGNEGGQSNEFVKSNQDMYMQINELEGKQDEKNSWWS